MAKLTFLLNVLLLLLAISYTACEGDQPTYTDCRPHIDATIRDLAGKALQAGEEPSEPEKLDYGEAPSSEDVVTSPQAQTHTVKEPESTKGSVEAKGQPEPPVVQSGSFMSVKQILQEKRKLESKNTKSDQKHASKKNPKNKKSKSKTSKINQKKTVEKAKKTPEKRTARSVSPAPVRDHVAKRHSSTPPSSKPKSDESLGIFDKIIGAVLGLPTPPRDPKYATPWSTHKEFARKASKDAKSADKKAVSNEPNALSKLINKAVVTIFGIPSQTDRDDKWAKPWQTHKEHARRDEAKAGKQVKKAAPAKPSFSFVNKFVEFIFGKFANERDTKFAKPWATHKEFQAKPKDASAAKPKPAVDHNQGGIIHKLITLVFKTPTEKRDEKWAKPWNTHSEFKRTDKKSVDKKTKVEEKPGFIGSWMNKFVYTVLGQPVTGPRSAKWAEPWNTHKEHARSAPKKSQKAATEVKSEPGMISTLINKAIVAIFGPAPEVRGTKWAKPWQQIKDEEKALAKAAKKQTQKRGASEPAKPVRAASSQQSKKQESVPPTPKYDTKQRQHSPSPSPPPPTPKYETKKKEHSPSPSPPPPAKVAKKAETPEPARKQPTPKREATPAPAPAPKQKHSEPQRKEDTPVKQEKPRQKTREVVEEDDDTLAYVPSVVRDRNHIESILGLDEAASYVTSKTDPIADATLRDMKKIYESAVKPLEKTYKYQDISNRHLSDAEIFGTPHILLLGPYSTGKSSFINYLLGTEFTKRALKTGTPPSHGVFRIIQYGDYDRELDGTDVGGQYSFTSLQKFGQNFVDQIKGSARKSPLLKKVTFIEAPGILEMRRSNERLYPFNDVLQWFIDRADLILIMFDYTKLDAGFEMEAILDQLKGREAQTRILLNKADQVPADELIKVQGSLFWNLSPLLGVSSPPIVYAGSFASLPYRPSSPVTLFQAQEEALLHDIAKAINARVDNRIAITRRHAVRVRNHASMVDSYLNTFYKNKGFLTSKHKLAEDIVENPHDYNIYEGISLQTNISRYDLPDAEVYRDFFRIHNLYDFRTLKETCGFLGGCPMEKLDAAISTQLPQLMTKHRRQIEAASPSAALPDTSFRGSGMGARAGHSQAGKS